MQNFPCFISSALNLTVTFRFFFGHTLDGYHPGFCAWEVCVPPLSLISSPKVYSVLLRKVLHKIEKKKKKRNSCLCNVELSMSWGCFLMTLYSYVLRICLLVLYIDSHGLQFSAVAVFLFSILAWCILMYKFNIVLVIIVCYICIYWQNDLLLSKLENSWEKGNDT